MANLSDRINSFVTAPEDESKPYDSYDNDMVQVLHVYAMKEKDNSQFVSIGKEESFIKNLVEDPPKEDSVTRMQMLIEEFSNATISLNPEIFGNALAINNIQFNQILQDNIGKEIVIPNQLITGKKFDEEEKDKKDEKTKEKSEKKETPLTDEEKHEYGEDAKKTEWEEDGKKITRIEGEDKIGQIHSFNKFTSSPTEADESFIKYKDGNGKSYEQQGKRTFDENGNQYLIKTINETNQFGGSTLDKGTTKVSLSKVEQDGRQKMLFKDRLMSDTDGKTLNARKISDYMSSFKDDSNNSDDITRYLDKRNSFENTNVPPSIITGSTRKFDPHSSTLNQTSENKYEFDDEGDPRRKEIDQRRIDSGMTDLQRKLLDRRYNQMKS